MDLTALQSENHTRLRPIGVVSLGGQLSPNSPKSILITLRTVNSVALKSCWMDVLAKRTAYVYDDASRPAWVQADLQGLHHPEERKEALRVFRRFESLAALGTRVIGPATGQLSG